MKEKLLRHKTLCKTLTWDFAKFVLDAVLLHQQGGIAISKISYSLASYKTGQGKSFFLARDKDKSFNLMPLKKSVSQHTHPN